MGKEQREAVLVVGVTPPHYQLRSSGGSFEWVLTPYEPRAFESFAKNLAASIRKRSDFAWMTTTFNVGSGTRTSSDPENPGEEALPPKKREWELIRALFQKPEREDYRILAATGKRSTAEGLPKHLSFGKPGGPSLMELPSRTALASPRLVYHFPGIKKIEALRKHQVTGWVKSVSPITLNEYAG